MPQDPVCGATVQNDALNSEYEGAIYYFCSQDCQQEFEDDPEVYVGWGGVARSEGLA